MQARNAIPTLMRRPFQYDPSRAQTVLLAPFDDANKTFTDLMGKTLTGTGPGINTDKPRWGRAFGNFGGATQRVTAASSTDWNFGTGPFQILVSINLTSVASDLEIIALRKLADTNSFWLIRKTAADKIRVYAKTTGTVGTDISTTAAFPVGGTAYHDLEIRRGANGLIAVWIDGLSAPLTTTTNTANFGWPAPATTPLMIGNGDDSYSNGIVCRMQWLRIKKGVAPIPEYRAFPPSGRYPISAY